MTSMQITNLLAVLQQILPLCITCKYQALSLIAQEYKHIQWTQGIAPTSVHTCEE